MFFYPEVLKEAAFPQVPKEIWSSGEKILFPLPRLLKQQIFKSCRIPSNVAHESIIQVELGSVIFLFMNIIELCVSLERAPVLECQ